MRALICHSAKDLRIETTQLPDMGPDQVRVNVAFGAFVVLICIITNTVVLVLCALNNRWHSGMKFLA
jgi:hypothetical protein